MTELLLWPNLVVLGFVFLYHLGLFVVRVISEFWTMFSPLFFICKFPVPLLLAGTGLIAHYGNVIEETGPTGVDELPRPLRYLSWREDLWGPVVQVSFALLLCFWPIAVGQWLPLEDAVYWCLIAALFLAGSIVVPATLLTTITSGPVANLRPDRVWAVMRTGGKRYLLLCASWLAAAAIYGFGISESFDLIGDIDHANPIEPWQWPAALAALIVGIYLMHWFCWQLGLYYRACHSRFPWLWQKFDKPPAPPPVPQHS